MSRQDGGFSPSEKNSLHALVTFERRPEPYLKIFRLKKGLKGEIIVQGKLNWSKVQDTVMDKGSRNNLGPLNIEFM